MAALYRPVTHATVPIGIRPIILLEAIEYQLGEVAGLGSLTYSLPHLADGKTGMPPSSQTAELSSQLE